MKQMLGLTFSTQHFGLTKAHKTNCARQSIFSEITNKNELKIWWLNNLCLPLHSLTKSKGV